MSSSPDPILRASELGEYVYCARAWWLHRVQGVPSSNTAALASGQQAHDQHGRAVARSLTQQRLAIVLLGLAVLLAVVAAVLVLATTFGAG